MHRRGVKDIGNYRTSAEAFPQGEPCCFHLFFMGLAQNPWKSTGNFNAFWIRLQLRAGAGQSISAALRESQPPAP